MTASIEVQPDHLSLSYASDDPIDHLDLDRAINDLAELRTVRKALADWEVVLETYIADSLGRNVTTVEGVGTVQVRYGTDRKAWEKHDLLRAVLDSHRPPSPDGEVHPSDDGHAEVAGEALSCSPDLARVLDCFNLPAPRVTALKERGIPVDEYCQSQPGRISVVIEGG